MVYYIIVIVIIQMADTPEPWLQLSAYRQSQPKHLNISHLYETISYVVTPRWELIGGSLKMGLYRNPHVMVSRELRDQYTS